MAASPLAIIRDINGYPTTGELTALAFTQLNQYFTLTASAVTNVTVPTGSFNKLIAYFTFATTTGVEPIVYVQLGSSPTLVVPTGTVTLTTAQINPGPRLVIPGSVIQFLSPSANHVVGISYLIPPQN